MSDPLAKADNLIIEVLNVLDRIGYDLGSDLSSMSSAEKEDNYLLGVAEMIDEVAPKLAEYLGRPYKPILTEEEDE